MLHTYIYLVQSYVSSEKQMLLNCSVSLNVVMFNLLQKSKRKRLGVTTATPTHKIVDVFVYKSMHSLVTVKMQQYFIRFWGGKPS